ncbi:MAG: sigma-70 family RNA polymerase sigma factor [Prevotella sp.]|nr:sigma-70 family RNA polymerase sigma factor [Prevotella sp.]
MSKRLTSDAEQRLIENVLHGHSEAFKTLMDGYGDYVMRIVERMIPSEAEAREVVQDIFVGAYRTLKSYDAEKASFATWLTRIAYHKVADYQKRRGKTMLYIEEHESLIAHVTDEMADSIFKEATSKRIEILRLAIRRIPPDDQMLLQLYYTDDRPLKDIAYILDRPPNYLATRLQRIRNKLYIIIKELEQHDDRQEI